MDWFGAPDYWLSRLVFQRALAAVYLVAFLAAANQFRALLGERGLLPVPRYLAEVPFRRAPSLFHLHYSDRFFAAVAWTGVILSAATVVGLTERAPLWAAMLVWAVLWVLYLSIVNVGQRWYAFGWESLLLEAGFLAIFLGNARTAPPVLVLWLMRWLLFRVEFGAGLIKLRYDPCWRNLTCLDYHHETQPMPGPLSWFFHRLPGPLHRTEVAANHFTQLVAPIAIFFPQPVAGIAAGVVIVTQLWLVLSGNFALLNWLTIAIAIPALGDSVLRSVLGPVLPATPPELAASPTWHQGAVLALTVVVVVLSVWPVRNMASRHQVMNYSFDPFRLVNTYGAFGNINRRRYEVVVEGTDEAEVGPQTVWREYGFKGKPGDPRRRPPQVAPYHLRLDWQMWFIPMSARFARPWFIRFVGALLRGDRMILKLLRSNPFPETPPTFVRARLYHYRFTSWAERRATGAWWERNLVGEYLQPVSLRETSTP
ncbi:MAG: lipase maturation factor family protein [Streptosporangiales bacterium]|nr:lipase maturation factor family protein [Streptosporangiales bacterium]